MANVTKSKATGFGAAAFAEATSRDSFEAARPKQSAGGTPYLRLDSDDGSWSFGQDDGEVPAGSLWAAIPQSFGMGWAAWKGKKIIGKAMAGVMDDPVDPTTLPPVKTQRGWEENVSMTLVCIDGPDDAPIGQVVLFEGTAKGVLDCWNKAFDALKARAKGGHEDFAPVIELSHRTYEHDEWGTVHVPVMKPKSWDVPEELIADYGEPPALENKMADDADAQDEAPKPKSRKAKAAEPEVEPDVVDAEVIDETPADEPEAEDTPADEPEDDTAAKPRRRRRKAAA